ncbi:hypothetical protein NHP164001_12410 [Helicobacter trogontum]|uniref:Uncharacterized protein n=1 Tax=Helicobacter trogontum TaxID=50960 RepID=A0ABQ0D4E9_9HELI|nr:hypothetical protein [Helicobacter trogontum]
MRNWIYPTIVFVCFLYAMAFILFYTYKGVSSYSGGKSQGVTTVESFQSEMNKKIQ